MESIRKFIIKVLIFSISLAASVILLDNLYIHNNYRYDYLGGILNDKHKVAAQTPSPKLIWVGGSSISFGINSDTLQRHLGIPVVNMALVAPLGTYFLMNDALKEVKRGDKVFITTEYDISRFGNEEVIRSAIDFYPQGANFVKKEKSFLKRVSTDIRHRFSNIRKLFWTSMGINKSAYARIEDSTSVYFRGAFSAKGDIVSHVNNRPSRFVFTMFPKDTIDYSGQIEDINHLIQEAERRGAEVNFVFPPIAKSTYRHGKMAVESVESQIKTGLKCTVLGSAIDFVYEDSSFFDTFYHLKPSSRDDNTQKILELYNHKPLVQQID